MKASPLSGIAGEPLAGAEGVDKGAGFFVAGFFFRFTPETLPTFSAAGRDRTAALTPGARAFPVGAVRFPRAPQGATLLTRVDELIDPLTHTWDEQLVEQSFNAADAEVVLKIPIFEHHEDFVAWKFDSKGLFYVRSA